MIRNPFMPSDIAALPDEFFGRRDELRTFERSIGQGYVAIQGPMGIGKSSLLARALLLMEGFDSNNTATSVVVVGNKSVETIDDAARLILESFTDVDERSARIGFKIGSLLEIESGEIKRYFTQGRHLAALSRVVEREYLDRILDDRGMLILAIDEADRCPRPLAQMIRALATHAQHHGVKRLRFVVAGVSPFFQEMVNEDQGLARFFYRTIMLQPMHEDEARDLLETKLLRAAEEAESQGATLQIDPRVIGRVLALAGGHPHLLQLLGSHLIEREDEDPDGVIDSKDLSTSLRRICYEDRARVYEATIRLLELSDRLDALQVILGYMPRGFPSRIDKAIAIEQIGPDAVQWLLERNILSSRSQDEYGLVDEFLRVRLLLDEADSDLERMRLEQVVIEGAMIGHAYFDDPGGREELELDDYDKDSK